MSLADHGIITGLVPVNGWHYIQKWEGGEQRIPPQGEARDDTALVRQVILFRVNQQMELGDVEADVADYIKAISPRNIRANLARHQSREVLDYTPLFERIREWIRELLPQRPRLVREGIALERGRVCLDCPQHIKWQSVKCQECNGSIEYSGRNLRQKAAFSLDKELTGGCRLHGFLCAAAIFLDLEFLPQRHASAPENCWLT